MSEGLGCYNRGIQAGRKQEEEGSGEVETGAGEGTDGEGAPGKGSRRGRAQIPPTNITEQGPLSVCVSVQGCPVAHPSPPATFTLLSPALPR